MHAGDPTATLTGADLRKLQVVLRKRASNVKKQRKRRGILRPLSKQDVDFDSSTFRKPLVLKSGTRTIEHAPWYLLNPEGLLFSVWNFTAVLLIVALVFYLPLLSAFFDEPAACNYFHITEGPAKRNSGIPGQFLSFGWQLFPVITNYFFIVDICIHCLTAVQVDITTKDYSLFVIWSHYARKWLWVDALACLPLECILYTAAPDVTWYNTPKFIRLVRVAGIWRRSRGNPFRVVDRISDLRQEFSFSARRISMAAFALLAVVHWYACILWWVIRLQDYPRATWPSQLGIVNTGVPEQYCWSLFVMVSAAVQLTWGGYNPITWGEALVWTFAMVTVAILFVIMVGFIIASIKSSSRGHTRYKDSMDAVMDTLDCNEVSGALRKRIMAFYRYKYRDGKINQHEQLLQELPYDMQVEAALHSAAGFLKKVALLAEEPTLLERVALLLRPTHALVGEEILRQASPVHGMYFVRAGFVDIIIDGSVADTVYTGDMFGEVALLSPPPLKDLIQVYGAALEDSCNHKQIFPSIFTAQALTSCDLYYLDAAKFHELLEEYPAVKAKLQAWALRYAQQLMKYNTMLGQTQTLHSQETSFLPLDSP